MVYWREGISPYSYIRAIEVLNKELGVEHLDGFVPTISWRFIRPVISLYSNYDVGKQPFANKETALELAAKIREILKSPRAPDPLWYFDDRPSYDDEEEEDDDDVRAISCHADCTCS